MECSRRGIEHACIDGNRRIPKYLLSTPAKRPTLGHLRGPHFLHPHLDAIGDLAKTTGYWALPSNSVNEPEAIFTEKADPQGKYSDEQSLIHFADPRMLQIASPTRFLNPRMAGSDFKVQENRKVQSPTADMDSFLIVPVGSHGSYIIQSTIDGKTSIGFTISSGWSSTFLY